MKFMFIVISVFFAVGTIYSQETMQFPLNPEDPSTVKDVFVKCNDESKLTKCIVSLNKTLVNPIVQGSFFLIVPDTDDRSAIEVSFLGRCTKAIEILRNITDCGLQDCSNVSCPVTFNTYNYGGHNK